MASLRELKQRAKPRRTCLSVEAKEAAWCRSLPQIKLSAKLKIEMTHLIDTQSRVRAACGRTAGTTIEAVRPVLAPFCDAATTG